MLLVGKVLSGFDFSFGWIEGGKDASDFHMDGFGICKINEGLRVDLSLKDNETGFGGKGCNFR